MVPVVPARGGEVSGTIEPRGFASRVDPGIGRSPEAWREFYEEQGREALEAGHELECSTEPIIDVVRRMTADPRWTYTSVLDVGCGASATYEEHLQQLGKRVVSIDFSYPFLSIAKRKGQSRGVQADATCIPFPDAAFDAVICSETLEHIPDDPGVIAEIERVLRPGGLLFLTVPNYWHAMRFVAGLSGNPAFLDMQVGHVREYSRRKVDVLLGSRFAVRARYSVPFLWKGFPGSQIDALIRHGILTRLSVSVALVAERRTA